MPMYISILRLVNKITKLACEPAKKYIRILQQIAIITYGCVLLFFIRFYIQPVLNINHYLGRLLNKNGTGKSPFFKVLPT